MNLALAMTPAGLPRISSIDPYGVTTFRSEDSPGLAGELECLLEEISTEAVLRASRASASGREIVAADLRDHLRTLLELVRGAAELGGTHRLRFDGD